MTPHMHQVITPGCYRCDLNLDEVAAAERESADQVEREAACPSHEWLERHSDFEDWRVCAICGKEDAE